jgi:Fe-S-cluster-containing dehydrogenase component
MKQWYMIIDIAKCENCANCFLACKDEFVENTWTGYSAPQPNLGQKWMNIHGKERGKYPFIDVAYIPVPCMHCSDAPCVKAVKDGALYRRADGIVIIDPEKSRGLKNIAAACPYGSVWWNDKLEIPQKCTFCAHLLDDGWTKPRCVQACPTGALALFHIEDSKIEGVIKKEKLEAYLPEKGTHPHVLYKNLYRFTSCFIGGSLATKISGKEECLVGAKVIIFDNKGEKVGESVTDNYGDFKVDNLPPDSGKYKLVIYNKDILSKELETVIKETSCYIGVIYI